MKQSLPGKILRAIAARRGSLVAPLGPGWQRERELIAETRKKTQLLLTDPAALHLLVCARAARRLSGAFAEAGVYKGGSARLVCEEKGEKDLHLFDVFGGLQVSAATGGEEIRAHFGSTYGSLGEVRELLAAYPNVHLHSGIFPDTARGLEALRFSFVHLDLDLASSTRAALEFFHPRMTPCGILLIDDYCDRYVKGIVDDWFAAHGDALIELPFAQMMVVCQPSRSAPDVE